MKPVNNKLIKKLTKLCPKANKLSLLHLAIAIGCNYKFYCTGDKKILSKSAAIKKLFSIDIVSDPYTTGSTFNYYI
jgi:hypothetical protein